VRFCYWPQCCGGDVRGPESRLRLCGLFGVGFGVGFGRDRTDIMTLTICKGGGPLDAHTHPSYMCTDNGCWLATS
jgi:hypothetical protein